MFKTFSGLNQIFSPRLVIQFGHGQSTTFVANQPHLLGYPGPTPAFSSLEESSNRRSKTASSWSTYDEGASWVGNQGLLCTCDVHNLIYIYIYIYRCVYICMYVCMYVCMYLFTCIQTFIYIYIYICIHLYVSINTYIYIYMFIYTIYTYVSCIMCHVSCAVYHISCICVCMHIYVYICTYIYTYVPKYHIVYHCRISM